MGSLGDRERTDCQHGSSFHGAIKNPMSKEALQAGSENGPKMKLERQIAAIFKM